MKTTARIIAIGNSRGIRIPKKTLEELHMNDRVEIETRANDLIIRPAPGLRDGWEESAKELHKHGEDALLLGELPPSDWDKNEWIW